MAAQMPADDPRASEPFDLDQLLDSLPPHLRKQVLNRVELPDDLRADKDETTKHKVLRETGWIVGFTLVCVFWTLPVFLFGVMLCLTLFLAPVGIMIIGMAVAGPATMIERRIWRKHTGAPSLKAYKKKMAMEYSEVQNEDQ